MFLVGLLTTAWLLPAPRVVAGTTFDIHTLLYASLLVLVGVQSMLFWMFAKVYGMREGIVPPDPALKALLARIQLEKSLIAAGLLLLLGIVLAVTALGSWQVEAFGRLDPDRTMRLVIPSATLILLGFQVAYSGFFLSILDIRGTPIETPTIRSGKLISSLLPSYRQPPMSRPSAPKADPP